MPVTRRHLLHSSCASALIAGLQQPALGRSSLKTARIVTGYTPGGISDTTCRLLATKLAPGYAKTVTVENRSGAGGRIAVAYGKSQAADGATIIEASTSVLALYPHIFRKLSYDPQADLSPVSLACLFHLGFAVGPAVPLDVKTLRDFMDWAKAEPEGANFGSAGEGSSAHFIGAMLGKSADVELTHVAYRGSQPAMLSLLGGEISAVCAPTGSITPHLSTGQIRMLGLSGISRSAAIAGVPTFSELGFNGLPESEWLAFFLPAVASPVTIARLNAAMKTGLASRDVVDQLSAAGLTAMSSTPDELAYLLRQHSAQWASIVRDSGFTVSA